MGTLSKPLLDQSAQFPSEPLLAPESLTNFLNMHFTEKNTFCDPFLLPIVFTSLFQTSIPAPFHYLMSNFYFP